MEGGRKRKALSDCTNRIHNTAAAAAAKKPSLASAFKKILENNHGKAVNNSSSKPCVVVITTSNENVVESSATVNPGSSVAVASTPTKNSMVSGTGEREVVEPCSIYSRRRTADRRKSKGEEVVGPLPISIHAIGDGNKEVTGPPKSSTVHHKKKKKDEPVHAMPQDFIEKQRAYFAEVDAFELPEEEVEATDQLE